MPATLKQLSDNEIQIFNECMHQQRNTGVRLVDTSSEWLFKDYESIHDEYLRLFEQSTDENIKLEALKRLIFLNWNGLLEDEYYTGIKSLNKQTIFNSYKALDFYIKENKLNEELKEMLLFYSCWDWLILDFSENKLESLSTFVKTVDPNGSFTYKSLNRAAMDNRGRMGIYWKELLERI